MCHGDNGDGKTDIAASMQLKLGDWSDPKTLASKSDQQLFDDIRKGTSDKMPPEDASRAKVDEVWGLVTYIRALAKAQTAPAQPAPEQSAPAQTAPEQPAPEQPAPASPAPQQPAPAPTN